MRCLIDGISHKGEGVARIDGKATFIPSAIPGETVNMSIVEVRKSYQRARLEEVVNASPDRVVPPCPYYFSCGGCSFQHVEYKRQLELKRQVVKETLKRIGGIDIEVKPVFGMEKPWHYRNKVAWHTGKKSGRMVMGYYLNDSRELTSIDSCLLLSPEMQECSTWIREHLDEMRVPAGCEIIVRQSSINRKIMLIFKGGAGAIDFAGLMKTDQTASIYGVDQGITRLYHGERTLSEKISDLEYEVSPLAFFQVNHEQTEKMMAVIKDYAAVGGNDTVLDAYCGTGTITLALAGNAREVVGVEDVKPAVRDARSNALRNYITNCRFIQGSCEEIIPRLEAHFDVVVMDPPGRAARLN